MVQKRGQRTSGMLISKAVKQRSILVVGGTEYEIRI